MKRADYMADRKVLEDLVAEYQRKLEELDGLWALLKEHGDAAEASAASPTKQPRKRSKLSDDDDGRIAWGPVFTATIEAMPSTFSTLDAQKWIKEHYGIDMTASNRSTISNRLKKQPQIEIKRLGRGSKPTIFKKRDITPSLFKSSSTEGGKMHSRESA